MILVSQDRRMLQLASIRKKRTRRVDQFFRYLNMGGKY